MYKNILHPFRFFALLLVVAGFTACKSTYEPQPNVGYFSVYNLSPSYATYDIYYNQSKQNTASIPFGGGINYKQLVQGEYELKFTTATYPDDMKYKKTGLAIGDNVFSSFYLCGTEGNLDGLWLTDSFGSATAADKSYIRFVNLSPDAPTLDLRLKDSTTVIFSNKGYKEYSEFIPVKTGVTTYEIVDHNSGTVLSTLEPKTLHDRYFYTIVAGGKIAPTDMERTFRGLILTNQ